MRRLDTGRPRLHDRGRVASHSLDSPLEGFFHENQCSILLPYALFVALIAPLSLQAQDSAPSKTIAAALQPFVDSHALAGAVTLVADKDKVLSLERSGYADIAANQADEDRRAVLDRLAVEADHRRRVDDARGRRQGEARRSRWRNTCRSSRTSGLAREQDKEHSC